MPTTTPKPVEPCEFCKLEKKRRSTVLCNFALNITDGVLITGSGNSAGNTSELYLPYSGVSCTVTKLPDGRYLHRWLLLLFALLCINIIIIIFSAWRSLAWCAEDTGPRTAASSGAPTLAPGRSCSLWTWADIFTPPGPHTMASAHTSWVDSPVTWHQLWLNQTIARSQASSLNMKHSKRSSSFFFSFF